MATDPDPYRTLGLAPGASTEEIRRAYRRLAKANHPDSAGEAALPRFLAIHAAYEALVGPGNGRPAGSGTGAGRSRPAPAREPWRADPDRARSARSAYGRRGARGAAPPGGGASSDAAGPTETRARRPTGDGRRGTGPKRPANKATPGSTTYDAAAEDAFEPEWSGGTWYGASSGTYWTINPKEYADPRKHGPEYQRRARRLADDAPPAAPLDDGDAGAIGDDEGLPGSETGPDSSRSSTSTGPAPAHEPAADLGPGGGLAGILAFRSTAGGRVGLALVGWPAIGLALTTIAGEITGCGRFAAGCVDLFGVGTWIAQLVIITILLALPTVAWLSAVGTITALAASVPTAVVLSATGGSREPAASAAALGFVLTVAYISGIIVAIVRRGQIGRVPWP
ncbi:MAG TPA: DnaJ domain-containing protein [Candidatus Limnocylindrales bacterium]|jgi:hypothetical protein|nr:DnaJ domain-containing protein [Candidatus Limnocylindrales bacterium]